MQRPDYVDKATGQVFDTNAANFEGWLTKQSVWLKDWRRRYECSVTISTLCCQQSSLAEQYLFDQILVSGWAYCTSDYVTRPCLPFTSC